MLASGFFFLKFPIWAGQNFWPPLLKTEMAPLYRSYKMTCYFPRFVWMDITKFPDHNMYLK